jgi:hypothetical protein
MTTCYYIFPDGLSPGYSRLNMINVELGFREDFGAVLASEAITNKNLSSRKLYMAGGTSIKF